MKTGVLHQSSDWLERSSLKCVECDTKPCSIYLPKPMTFQLQVQFSNHCATMLPHNISQSYYKYRVSSGWLLAHATTAAFSARMSRSPSVSFRSRVFRTQPIVSARTSVHCRSVRRSWTTVTVIRRWMPWCSRNVPQQGRSSECDTLVDT